MDKEYLQDVHIYLKEKWTEYKFADRSQRALIEKWVISYSRSLDDELYGLLNENAASGLFKHGFFEADLERCMSILERMLDSDS